MTKVDIECIFVVVDADFLFLWIDTSRRVVRFGGRWLHKKKKKLTTGVWVSE